MQALKKNLVSKYSAQFENEDKMLTSKVNRELVERRQNQMSEFMSWRLALRARHDADSETRNLLRGKIA